MSLYLSKKPFGPPSWCCWYWAWGCSSYCVGSTTYNWHV